MKHGYGKLTRDPLCAALAARDTLQGLSTDTIDIDPEPRVRDAILSIIENRERIWFGSCLRLYREELESAEDEHRKMQCMLRAKAEIQPLTREDRLQADQFPWPARPVYRRLMYANEMRLCQVLAYRVQLQLAKTAALRRVADECGLEVSCRDDGPLPLPSCVTDEVAFCNAIEGIQQTLQLPGVWKGFWMPMSQLQIQLLDGHWSRDRADALTVTSPVLTLEPI